MAPPWPSGDPRSTVERPRKDGPNGPTSPSVTDREDRRHERRGIHDARHLGRTLSYWPHPAGGFLTSDALQQTTRGGLRTHWSRPPTTSSPVRVPPSPACSRSLGQRAAAPRPSATAGRSDQTRAQRGGREAAGARDVAIMETEGAVGIDWPVTSATFSG